MFALGFDRVAVEALIAGRLGPSAAIKLSPQDDIRDLRSKS
jgi:hypothetical protein